MYGFSRLSTKVDKDDATSSIDLESGGVDKLYPGISVGENQLRWGFIRKVYGILSAQIVLTTVVSSATVLYSPINDLLKGNSGVLLFFMILPIICVEKLYPGISVGENQLRWDFIKKVYGILSAQIVLTTVVSSATVLYSPINELLKGNSGVLLFFMILPFILLWPLYKYQQKHPLNLAILGLFTASLSLTVGVACANTDGKLVLEALILTSAVVTSLTGYTFWASKKGKDFSYLGPILFTSLFTLVLTGFMQMFFPLGSTTNAIYGAISAIIFSGYIIYDTDNLIKRFTYDEYIWASVNLYLDILNLFLTILRLLRQGDN